MSVYHVKYVDQEPDAADGWDGPVWQEVPPLDVAEFRPEGTDHHPHTQAKLAYGENGLYGFFRVEDRYVRCVTTAFQGPVWQDSCVEFFVQPRPDRGYFNFEMNCGGALLAYYITNPARLPGGFEEYTALSEADGRQALRQSSLPPVVDPEIAEPVTWCLQFNIPYSLLEKYTGPVERGPGSEWRANFCKCGDGTSHPHWAAWAPVDELNFHLPRCFGVLRFDQRDAPWQD